MCYKDGNWILNLKGTQLAMDLMTCAGSIEGKLLKLYWMLALKSNM